MLQMIKEEAKQINSNTLSFIQQRNQDQSYFGQQQNIDIGPWNSQTENFNQILDIELSLSKYNQGFYQKNGIKSKKRVAKKNNKRSLSQMENQEYKRVQDLIKDEVQRQESNIIKTQENTNQKQLLTHKLDYEIGLQPLQRGVNANQNLEDQKTQNKEQVKLDIKYSFLKPITDKYLNYGRRRSTKLVYQKPYTQEEEICQIHTEPSQQLFKSIQFKNEKLFQSQITQNILDLKNSQDSIKFKQLQKIRYFTPSQENTNFPNNYLQLNNNENQRLKTVNCNYNFRTNSQRRKQSLQTQTIENGYSLCITQENQKNHSLSSLSLSDSSKNQDILITAADVSICQNQKDHLKEQLIKQTQDNIQLLQSTPTKIGNLFQVSSKYNKYKKIDQKQNDHVKYNLDNQKYNIHEINQDFCNKRYSQNQKIVLNNFNKKNEIQQQQSQKPPQSVLISVKEQNQNWKQEDIDSENIIKVSRNQYQNINNKNNILNQQQTQQNEKRIILRDMVIATNIQTKNINRFSKNVREDFEKDQISFQQNQDTNIQQKKGIQPCFVDLSSQKTNSIQQFSNFNSLQNQLQQTIQIAKDKCDNRNNKEKSIDLEKQIFQTELNNFQLYNNQLNHKSLDLSVALNKQEQDQRQNTCLIYRKAPCSKNQLKFDCNISQSPVQHNNKRNQQLDLESKSLLRSSCHDIYHKQFGGQFSIQNNKSKRSTSTPKQTEMLFEYIKIHKKEQIDLNNEKIKKQNESNQLQQARKSINPQIDFNHLPKIKYENTTINNQD
ncbi:hypothetical protein TTHERM_00295280 (macronuclear) [Tetrahymena thermophila SB210]|uniref:Uncharacterized protein n=1 Tax=Tetrahymena thermophila (strain SB210) TaxID=312017 RepID=I7MID3_TETTS|nr:hypothetical protein TTHERM_00295280 [Tetrahymena thermophila SB210]EAR92915.2 hypothetical protein TTHERM_00295280 [Tetrahymena thermophila SB210]|eukprot:XP_001013160.2 hypothetical protein TTHERM_00295280 [Tetrahymena thermophila SB210]